MPQRRNTYSTEYEGANTSGNDDEENDRFDLGNRIYYDENAELSGVPSGVYSLTANDRYGHTVIFEFDDLLVEDGLLYNKSQDIEDNPRENKHKVRAWSDFGITEVFDNGQAMYDAIAEKGLDAYPSDEIHGTVTYTLMGGRMALEDEDGNDASVSFFVTDDGIVTGEQAEQLLTFESARVHYGTHSSGPRSASKRAVKLWAENGADDLTPSGVEMVADPESGEQTENPTFEKVDWFRDDIEVANELTSQRVRFWEEEVPVPGSDDDRNYKHLYAVFDATGKFMPVRYGDSSGEAADVETEVTEPENTEYSDAVMNMLERGGRNWADNAEDFIDLAVREGEVPEDEVEANRDDLVAHIQNKTFA